MSHARKYDLDVLKNLYEMKRNKTNMVIGRNFRIAKGIMFNDMTWNFKYFNTDNRKLSLYRYKFENFPSQFQFYSKLLLLNELIVKKRDPPGVESSYKLLKTLINQLDEFGCKNIIDIDIGIAEKTVVLLEHKSIAYRNHILRIFCKLLEVASEVHDIDFSSEISFLEDSVMEEIRRNTTSNDYIPDYFYDQTIALALKDINDETLSNRQKMIACLIVIMAETGMRAEEITLIERDRLETLSVNGKSVNFMNFNVFKIRKEETQTFMTENATFAYKKLSEITLRAIENLSEISLCRALWTYYTGKELRRRVGISELREKRQKIPVERQNEIIVDMQRYLFINPRTGLQNKGNMLLRENVERFYLRHRNDFDISMISFHEREKIKVKTLSSKAKYNKFLSASERKKISYEDAKKIEYFYVNPHMFRVTVCTKLFEQGIHISYIMKHMNHLTDDMTALYNKSEYKKDKLKQNLLYYHTVSELLNSDRRLNNHDMQLKKELEKHDTFMNEKKAIDEFLEKSNLKIGRDFNKILNILSMTGTTVTENDLGICISDSLNNLCEQRDYFSSASDFYHIGIQLPSYENINYTYSRFLNKERIVHHNKTVAEDNPNLQVEYEREVNALKHFVKKSMIFELDLLIEDLSSSSVEQMVEEFPHLVSVITRVDEIRKEALKWIQ